MASEDDSIGLDPAELARIDEAERKRRALLLSQQIAQKYDGSRLGNFIVNDAGRGEKLEAGLQSEMERRLGGRFHDVRVFRGGFAEAVTKAHRADAVTVANTGMILVREGPRSDPRTALGKALIAHELTHVSQAQRGLHFALEGGESQNAPHEQEAEHVERTVHAEESGNAPGKKKQASGGVDKAKVIERVLELVEESARLTAQRHGHGGG